MPMNPDRSIFFFVNTKPTVHCCIVRSTNDRNGGALGRPMSFLFLLFKIPKNLCFKRRSGDKRDCGVWKNLTAAWVFSTKGCWGTQGAWVGKAKAVKSKNDLRSFTHLIQSENTYFTHSSRLSSNRSGISVRSRDSSYEDSFKSVLLTEWDCGYAIGPRQRTRNNWLEDRNSAISVCFG